MEKKSFSWLQAIKAKLKRTSQSQYYEFLPSHLALIKSPPSLFAMVTATTLSLGIIAALAWSYIGKLDVQATTQGRLIVSGHSQVIQAYEQGRLVHLYVKEGQHVEQGEALLGINVLGVSQDILSLGHQIDYHNNERLLYSALLTKTQPDTQTEFTKLSLEQQQRLATNYQSILNEFNSIIDGINTEIDINTANIETKHNELKILKLLRANIEKRLSAHKKLSQQQMISKNEYLEQERELLMTQKEIIQKQSEITVLQAQKSSLLEKLTGVKIQKQQEWYEKQKNAEFQVITLEQEFNKTEEREQLEIIRSPVTGTVQELSTYTIGAVLQSSQNVMVIVPDNDVQIAEVKILNKDIGFIRPGQNVTVKLDTFPYTRYGTIDGKVLSISRDSTQDENLGLVFIGQISLDKNTLTVEGKEVELTPGLSIVAEIKTDQRRVIDYILSPVKEYMSEAMREK
nr:HlyD family type I secretion periplasmic adaptor subunit [uncultured Moellerella sp.]